MKDGGEIDWECSKCSQQQVPSPKIDVSMFAPPFNSTWAQHLPDDEEPRLTEISSDEAIPAEDSLSLHIIPQSLMRILLTIKTKIIDRAASQIFTSAAEIFNDVLQKHLQNVPVPTLAAPANLI